MSKESFNIREFIPAIMFLTRFLLSFGILSILYNFVYLKPYKEAKYPDPVSVSVTAQSVWTLNLFGFNAHYEIKPKDGFIEPTINDMFKTDESVYIMYGDRDTVRVIEGCNGIAVMILFLAFVFAFAGPWKRKLWFILFGIVVIHLANITRISLLSYISTQFELGGYKIQKHLFTAFIYIFVLGLWYWWVNNINKPLATDEQK